ncbi:Peptidase_C39 like family protein [Anaerocolumna jejuensis DSM 15929]|uniref:Peptidase_C39 like family protein n=1 Tax=Anaerocolumna jejuensis DSM 15929 TaxID=1121322 RepID=A0A1M6RWJ8_9FIRM|nr:C39 family peptidase [Anaerocolumna jejuensis]SHK36872.1 Peptidase_C39 like family protein [Anaerocolumna jejuensis DSM 15929]
MFHLKNLSKSFLVLTMVTAFTFSSIVPANAATSPTKVKNSDTSLKKQTETFSNGMGGAYVSQEENTNNADLIKLEATKKLAKNISIDAIQPLAANWVNLPGTTYRYEQLDPYYCVPATMQTILRYNNGTTPPTQDTIAKAMNFKSGSGVDFLKVAPYLNGVQTKNSYATHSKSAKDDMTYRINADISNYVVPTSIRIQVSNSSDWFYTTSGHALVANDIRSDKSEVQLVDPAAGYSWYTKTTSNLFKVFTHLAW